MQNNLIGISGKIGSGKDAIGQLAMIIKSDLIKNEPSFNETNENSLLNIVQNWDKYSNVYHTLSGFEIKKFAYKLKMFVSLLTGIPIADLEKAEVKDSKLGEEWAYLLYWNGKNMLRNNPSSWNDFDPNRLKHYTVRQMLQYVGTELFRNQFHENTWVNALFADYKPTSCGWDADGKETLREHPKWIITDVRFPNEADVIKKKGGLLIRTNNPDYMPYDNEHYSETALDNYKGFDQIITNNKQEGILKLYKTVSDIIKR